MLTSISLFFKSLSLSKILFILSNIILFIVSFLAPISILIHSMFFLVFVDLITAIILRSKTENGFLNKVKVVESKKIRKSAIKIFLYLIFMISIYVLVTPIYPGIALPSVKIITFFLGLTELTSIAANMNHISGNTVFTDALTKIKNKMVSSISKLFD